MDSNQPARVANGEIWLAYIRPMRPNDEVLAKPQRGSVLVGCRSRKALSSPRVVLLRHQLNRERLPRSVLICLANKPLCGKAGGRIHKYLPRRRPRRVTTQTTRRSFTNSYTTIRRLLRLLLRLRHSRPHAGKHRRDVRCGRWRLYGHPDRF